MTEPARIAVLVLLCSAACVCAPAAVRVTGETAAPAAPAAKLVVYADGILSPPYTPSGWMGNRTAITLDPHCPVRPHTGATCMKLQYRATDQWAGVVWQHPPNDWGEQPGGYNLSGATKLTFWARGESGGEKVRFVFGVINREKPYFDTASGALDVVLSQEWMQYSFDLTGKSLERIKTGFGWTVAGQGRPVTFYLDDIQYE